MSLVARACSITESIVCALMALVSILVVARSALRDANPSGVSKWMSEHFFARVAAKILHSPVAPAPFSSGRIASAAAREEASHGKIESTSSLQGIGSMSTEANFVGMFANKLFGFFLFGVGAFWIGGVRAFSLDTLRISLISSMEHRPIQQMHRVLLLLVPSIMPRARPLSRPILGGQAYLLSCRVSSFPVASCGTLYALHPIVVSAASLRHRCRHRWQNCRSRRQEMKMRMSYRSMISGGCVSPFCRPYAPTSSLVSLPLDVHFASLAFRARPFAVR